MFMLKLLSATDWNIFIHVPFFFFEMDIIELKIILRKFHEKNEDKNIEQSSHLSQPSNVTKMKITC